MNYEEWLRSVPIAITGDSLWKVEAYRLALFVGELGWHDVTKLIKNKRTMELADRRSTRIALPIAPTSTLLTSSPWIAMS
jgi:hypothetical protein